MNKKETTCRQILGGRGKKVQAIHMVLCGCLVLLVLNFQYVCFCFLLGFFQASHPAVGHMRRKRPSLSLSLGLLIAFLPLSATFISSSGCPLLLPLLCLLVIKACRLFFPFLFFTKVQRKIFSILQIDFYVFALLFVYNTNVCQLILDIGFFSLLEESSVP